MPLPAYAQVGTTAGTTTGAAGAASNPSWSGTQPRNIGDLLLCLVSGTGAVTQPTVPANWSGVTVAGASGSCGVMWKIATGADVAPSIALASGVTWNATLLEFLGNYQSSNTFVKDQSGSAASTASTSLSASMTSPDVAAGELIAFASVASYSTSASRTNSQTLNNGATVTAVGTNNTGVSGTIFMEQGFGITTGHASVDSTTFTVSTTSKLLTMSTIFVSFRLGQTLELSVPPLYLP